MSSIRGFALSIGIIYLLVGIAGFIPGLVEPPPQLAPPVHVHHNHGYLLGLFPVNTLHNLFHILIGIAGLVGYLSLAGARLYARAVAIIYGALALLGLIPVTNTLFGLLPIHGNDIWLHALTALAAAYFGWLVSPASRDNVDPLERPAGEHTPTCPPDPRQAHPQNSR